MWYLIIGHDQPESLAARQLHRPAHLARLHDLREQGRLLLAGPLPAIDSDEPGPAGFVGSAIVAEFVSQQAAIEWAEADPYRSGGVYQRVDVFPFKKVLP